ncbi:molybdopterin-guanine dinucleotide biosynthesis protein MobB [Desulfurococcaceae archaeon MEX13E-LK6-19]|nr:molybdopterin-guanine dinucleotide biosynthesis protein MobB [Desulfurococcaceae archaeon MEX13E-LK6-19]
MNQGSSPVIGLTAIYRIVGLASGIGKTTLGEEIVNHLARKGVRLAVIKQTHEHVLDKGTDAVRYRSAGAETVAIASPEVTLVLIEPLGNINEIISIIKYYPLVIAEGFKGSRYGKAIGIVETPEELEQLRSEEENLWLIVSHDFDLVEEAKEKGLNAILFEETDAIAEAIFKDAISTLSSLLPEETCRLCGLSSCLELAEKILIGEKDPLECPLATKVQVVADGKPLAVDPRVENLLVHFIKGIMLVTDGAPEHPKEIKINIKLRE